MAHFIKHLLRQLALDGSATITTSATEEPLYPIDNIFNDRAGIGFRTKTKAFDIDIDLGANKNITDIRLLGMNSVNLNQALDVTGVGFASNVAAPFDGYNHPVVMLEIRFKPDRPQISGAWHFLTDTHLTNRCAVFIDPTGRLGVIMQASSVLVAAAVVAPAWNNLAQNIIRCEVQNGTQDYYLNDILMASTAVAWTGATQTEIYIGVNRTVAVFYDGQIDYVRWYSDLNRTTLTHNYEFSGDYTDSTGSHDLAAGGAGNTFASTAAIYLRAGVNPDANDYYEEAALFGALDSDSDFFGLTTRYSVEFEIDPASQPLRYWKITLDQNNRASAFSQVGETYFNDADIQSWFDASDYLGSSTSGPIDPAVVDNGINAKYKGALINHSINFRADDSKAASVLEVALRREGLTDDQARELTLGNLERLSMTYVFGELWQGGVSFNTLLCDFLGRESSNFGAY